MANVILDLSGLRTPLFPLTRAKMLELERPITDRLQKWRMFCANNRLDTTDFHGKPICYSGIHFEGSPEHVFWAGHFEPFMIDAAESLFQWVIDHCRSQNLEAANYLAEANDLLKVFVIKTYDEMADTDHVLGGAGHPGTVQRKPIDHKISGMQSHFEELLLAMTHAGHVETPKAESTNPILKLEPNIYGIGINLRSLWARGKKKLGF